MLTEEERLLKATVQEFADQELAPRAGYYDEHGEFPWENARKMAELGLFGLTIDEGYGGAAVRHGSSRSWPRRSQGDAAPPASCT